jgi:hypothetical protein
MAMGNRRHQMNSADPSECHRCGGLMVTEWCSELDSMAWRCVQCGELIDAVILNNRSGCSTGALSPAVSLSGSDRSN